MKTSIIKKLISLSLVGLLCTTTFVGTFSTDTVEDSDYIVEAEDPEPVTEDDVTSDVEPDTIGENSISDESSKNLLPSNIVKKDYVFEDSVLSCDDYDTTITVTGEMPEGSTLSVTEVDVDSLQDFTDSDTQLVKAWDIKILDADGDEYQPEIYDKTIDVTFSSVEEIITEEANVIHITEDDDVETLAEEFIDTDETTDITVETDSFSTYGISAVASQSNISDIDSVYLTVFDETYKIHQMSLTSSKGVVTDAFCIDHGKRARSNKNFFCKGKLGDVATDVQNPDYINVVVQMYFSEFNGQDSATGYNLSYSAAQCLIWAFEDGFTSEADMRSIMTDNGYPEDRQDKIINFFNSVVLGSAANTYVWECEEGGPDNGWQRFISPVGGETSWRTDPTDDVPTEDQIRVRMFRDYEPFICNAYFRTMTNGEKKVYPKNITEDAIYVFDKNDFIPEENGNESYSFYIELVNGTKISMPLYMAFDIHDWEPSYGSQHTYATLQYKENVITDAYSHNDYIFRYDQLTGSAGGPSGKCSAYNELHVGYEGWQEPLWKAGGIISCKQDDVWCIATNNSVYYYSPITDKTYNYSDGAGTWYSGSGCLKIGNGGIDTGYAQTIEHMDFFCYYAPIEVYTNDGKYLGDIDPASLSDCDRNVYFSWDDTLSKPVEGGRKLSNTRIRGMIDENGNRYLTPFLCNPDNLFQLPVKNCYGEDVAAYAEEAVDSYRTTGNVPSYYSHTPACVFRYLGIYNFDKSAVLTFDTNKCKAKAVADGVTLVSSSSVETNYHYMESYLDDSDPEDPEVRQRAADGTDETYFATLSGAQYVVLAETDSWNTDECQLLRIRLVGADGKGVIAQDVAICGSATFDKTYAVRPVNDDNKGVYEFNTQDFKNAGFTDLHLFVNKKPWDSLYTFTDDTKTKFDDNTLSADMPEDSNYWSSEYDKRVKLTNIGSIDDN